MRLSTEGVTSVLNAGMSLSATLYAVKLEPMASVCLFNAHTARLLSCLCVERIREDVI